MKKEIKDFGKVLAKIKFTNCGNIACIHNIDNKCILAKCDIHEKRLEQEY